MLRLPPPRALCAFCLVLLFFLPTLQQLHGQSTTGVIGGTVYDPQHAVIPNARIVALNEATGAKFIAYTDKSGNYTLADLPPGTYSVDITGDAFTAFTATHVVVELGRRTPLDTTLHIGATSSTIPGGNHRAVSIHLSFDRHQYNAVATADLPSDSRRWSSFALLTPGVVADESGTGLLSFRGISGLLNNNTIDGADNNQAFFSEERGRTKAPYSISMAAVEQFQVNTADYSAEYGRAAGGVINTVTKSGTNQYHGGAFFFERNSSLSALNAYTTLTNFDSAANNFVTNPYRPTDVRRQMGFSVGGPIVRDKLFWFYSFDYNTRNFPAVSRVGYPTAIYAQPSPILPSGNYLGYRITCANLPPYNASSGTYASVFQFEATQGACELYDKLDLASYDAGIKQYQQGLQLVNTLTGPAPRTGEQTLNFPKIDWLVNDRNHATVSYNRMRWSSPNGVQTQSSTQYGVNSLGNDYVSVDWGILHLTTFVTENIGK